MTLTRRVLDRWLHRGACAITAVFVLSVMWQQLLSPVAYPAHLFQTWAIAASSTLAWALWDAWVCRPVPWGLRACVVVALLVGTVQVLGGWRLTGAGTVPPLLQAMAPAFGVAGFAFNPRTAAVLGLFCGGAYVVSDLSVVGSPLAFGLPRWRRPSTCNGRPARPPDGLPPEQRGRSGGTGSSTTRCSVRCAWPLERETTQTDALLRNWQRKR